MLVEHLDHLDRYGTVVVGGEKLVARFYVGDMFGFCIAENNELVSRKTQLCLWINDFRKQCSCKEE